MTRTRATGKHMATVPKEQRHASQKHKVALAIAIGLLVVLGGAYGYGVWYFSDHFLPNTTANGHDVSLLTTEALAQQIGDDAQAHQLFVGAGDFSTTLTAADMGLTVDSAAAANEAMERQQGLVARWPLEVANPHDYQVEEGVSVDDDAISSLVSSQVEEYNQTATWPVDATVGYSEEQGSYVVNPEVDGTALLPDVVAATACQAADAPETSASCDNSAFVQPTLRSDDEALNAAATKANEMLGVEIPLTVDGSTKVTVGRDQIAGWITFDENHNVGVDSTAVANYVRKTASPACAKNDDTHTYSVDRNSLTSSITAAVDAAESKSIEVPLVAKEKAKATDSQGASQTTWNGSGRYIDVDISRQYACLFDEQGKVLWESYVVTGNTSEGRSTPSGTYAINAKTTNMTLIGADENHDGKPDYESHVDYWMPFIGSSYGFHDASWRSKFGGSIYKSGGSHGCVNLPHAKAQQLFGLVQVGDKVSIHQ